MKWNANRRAEGNRETANPCGFALLPAYLARRLGIDDAHGGGNLDAVLRAIAVGAVTTAGFLLVFGVAGGAISFGAHGLVRVVPWAGFVIGLTLAAIGTAGWPVILGLLAVFVVLTVWGLWCLTAPRTSERNQYVRPSGFRSRGLNVEP